jgi:hypothetical protein
MNTGRVVLLVTCLVVAGLGGWFAVARWDDANRIAAFASALGAVAAVGVAIWAALRTTSSGSIVVRRTGRAESYGGPGSVRVEDTGTAASDGGDANTGARLD